MLGLIQWMLTGVLVGWVVSLLLWQKRERDVAQTMALGVFGAVFCGVVLRGAGYPSEALSDLANSASIGVPLSGALVAALFLSPSSRKALRMYAKLRVQARFMGRTRHIAQSTRATDAPAPEGDLPTPEPAARSERVALAAPAA